MTKFEQKENETRKEFLVRIAIYYIENTAGIIGIENYADLYYDDSECDGFCIADDLRIEFDINEF